MPPRSRRIPGGGLGGKIEDWLERLHQDGKRERLQFRTVQNPIARAHARERVHTRNIHPNIISQTNNINEGNKRNLAELKTDLMGMLQKRKRDVGRYEAMQYFMQDDTKRLSWLAPLFNDGKVDLNGENAHAAEYLCHLERPGKL